MIDSLGMNNNDRYQEYLAKAAFSEAEWNNFDSNYKEKNIHDVFDYAFRLGWDSGRNWLRAIKHVDIEEEK